MYQRRGTRRWGRMPVWRKYSVQLHDTSLIHSVQEKGHKALGQEAAVSHLAQMAAFMGLGIWWLLEPMHYGPAQVCPVALLHSPHVPGPPAAGCSGSLCMALVGAISGARGALQTCGTYLVSPAYTCFHDHACPDTPRIGKGRPPACSSRWRISLIRFSCPSPSLTPGCSLYSLIGVLTERKEPTELGRFMTAEMAVRTR